jgi:hypothetical protein
MKQPLINKFKVFCLKRATEEKRFHDAHEIIEYLGQNMKDDSLVGEFFAAHFEYLYQIILTNDFISDEIYMELLANLQQATIYNYKKYSFDLFLKFLVISNTKFSKSKIAK